MRSWLGYVLIALAIEHVVVISIVVYMERRRGSNSEKDRQLMGITAEEFERQYAERSGITVEQLRELGRIVAPCHCGDKECEGWQSTTPERIADEAKWRGGA
jgi:hypothetical protein